MYSCTKKMKIVFANEKYQFECYEGRKQHSAFFDVSLFFSYKFISRAKMLWLLIESSLSITHFSN